MEQNITLVEVIFFRASIALSIVGAESNREGVTYLLDCNTAACLKSFKNI